MESYRSGDGSQAKEKENARRNWYLLTTCCFGCSLEKGIKIIGWIQVIGGIVGANFIILLQILGSQNNDDYKIPSKDIYDVYTNQGLSVLNAIGFVGISLLGGVLLFAVGHKNRTALSAWMVITTSSLVLNLIALLLRLLSRLIDDTSLIVETSIYIMMLFFTWIVYSYYIYLEDSQPLI